jgi:Flp pilus assembly protein TadB
MMAVIVAVLTFIAVLCLWFGIKGMRNPRYLFDKLETKKEVDTEPFFESLWEFTQSGLSFDDVLKLALCGAALGVGVGMICQGTAMAIILGIAAFVLVPKIYSRVRKNSFVNRFTDQFARDVMIFSAAAKVMPIGNCAAQVVEEVPEPSKTVFKYIDESVHLGEPLNRAINKAAAEFNLPILNLLGDAVRTLDELGGGERSGELLDSVAEEARFKQNHKRTIKTEFSELKSMMGIATTIPVALFGFFALDSGSAYREAIVNAPWLVGIGVGVLICGWFWVWSLLKSAEKTL